MGVAVADWDEVGEAAGWVGEEGEDGVGVGRGREGRGGLERGFGRLLAGGDTSSNHFQSTFIWLDEKVLHGARFFYE